MIFLIFLLFHDLTVSSFRWYPEKPDNYNKNILPKYDATIEELPHHVLVYYARLYCSGSLISSRTVITCGSCFYKRSSETTYVKVGTRHYLDSKTQRIRVLEIKTHEFFRRLTSIDNDIALLFLEYQARLSNSVKKIPLAPPEVSLRYGQALKVSGYGGDNVPTGFKNQLLATAFVVETNEYCEQSFGNVLTSSTYCAKLYLTDQRLSDNGGGATLKDFLVGILLVGGNSDKSNTAVFTNVSYFHRWIVLNTQRFHERYCNKTVGHEEVSFEDYGLLVLSRQINTTEK